MGKIYIQICLSFILFFTPVIPFAQASEGSEQSLTQLIDQLKSNEDSKGAQVGISIFNVTKGMPIYQYHNLQSFVPASVQKLIVSAAALDHLGPTYRYRTEIYVMGQIHEGVLNGDLLIKGYGDPSFSVNDLREITKRLKLEKGLKQIKGNLLVDDTYFDSARLGEGWTWDDERWYYSAPIHALSIEGNRMKVAVRPGRKSPSVKVMPPFQETPVLNLAQMVSGTEIQLDWERPRNENTIHLSGTYGRHAGALEEELSIEDSPRVTGELWQKVLLEEHILFSRDSAVQYQRVQTTSKPFLIHESKPLSELVRHLNKESDNFYAEMFLKTLGANVKGEGSFQAGLEVIKDFLKQMKMPEGYRIVDGSGLSRYNLITPDQLTTLLGYIQGKSYKTAFMESLPIAGVDGTLEKRFLGTPLAGYLRAKTGSMSGVSSMAGYVRAKNGDLLAFAILMNGIYQMKDARAFQEQAILQLEQYPSTAPFKNKEEVSTRYSLSNVIDPILNQSELKHVHSSLVIKPLNNHNWIYARNPDTLLTPASITKLLLASTALSSLGSDFRYSTPIFWNPQKKALYVKGVGDPSIDEEVLKSLLQKLKIKGIDHIKSIVVDEGDFDKNRYPWGWSWDEETDGSHAQLSALSLDEGAAELHIKPGGELGSSGILSLEPSVPQASMVNQLTTGLFDLIRVTRSKGTNHFQVSGIIGSSQVKHVSVEDPATYFGNQLMDKARRLGLTTATCGVRKGIAPVNGTKIAEIKSKPLRDLISYMLKSDSHYYAEMITKTMGAGHTDQGVEKIYQFMKSRGIKPIFDLYDGSGVSHYNQISAEQIIAGIDEGLAALLPPIEDGVIGISGQAIGRRSFLGIVKSEKGKPYLVVLMQNGYTAEKAVFQRVQQEIIRAIEKEG